MAPRSSTLAWKIPWMEEPGRLQSMGLLRLGHDWATSLSLFLSCIGEGNVSQLQCSCLENPRDGGAWWAAVNGVAQSRTWLNRLSSSSSSIANVCVCGGVILRPTNERMICFLNCLEITRLINKCYRPVVPNLFGTRDQFHGRQFFPWTRGWWGDGFRMIQVHYIYCILYF